VGNFTAEVSSKIKYAYWLEFGTLTMAARPFMRPAVEKARPKFLARMTTAIARVIQ
jgi:HK97 gp10 family phage protein